MSYRVIVTGDRHYAFPENVACVLDGLLTEHGTLDVAQGGATGADAHALDWCRRTARSQGDGRVRWHTFDADWWRWSRLAGCIRNRRMLQEFEPHLVVAFKDDFDGAFQKGGTEHMCKIAREAGVPVMLVLMLP